MYGDEYLFHGVVFAIVNPFDLIDAAKRALPQLALDVEVVEFTLRLHSNIMLLPLTAPKYYCYSH